MIFKVEDIYLPISSFLSFLKKIMNGCFQELLECYFLLIFKKMMLNWHLGSEWSSDNIRAHQFTCHVSSAPLTGLGGHRWGWGFLLGGIKENWRGVILRLCGKGSVTKLSNRKPWCWEGYQFPRAFVTNCHKLSGLNQHKFILLQLWRSEV